MKRIASIALLSLLNVSVFLFSSQATRADEVVYCHPATDNQAPRNSVDNPRTYAYGYREGEQSFRDGVAYKPRTKGGEFARGFEDGYFNRPYDDRGDVLSNRVVQSTNQNCNEDRSYSVAPSPTVIYTPYVVSPPVIYGVPYAYPNPIINLDFGFGGGYYHGWHHHRHWW